MGIVSGSGSFPGRFGDHFRVGDHFAVGIISGLCRSFAVGEHLGRCTGVSNVFQRTNRTAQR